MGKMLRWAMIASLPLLSSAADVAAQSSTALIAVDPRGQYAAIRAAVRSDYLRNQRGPELYFDGRFNLNNCGASEFLIGRSERREPLLLGLTDLAIDVTYWSVNLRRLGFPEGAWRPHIDRFEAAGLDAVLARGGRAEAPAEVAAQQRRYREVLEALARDLGAARRSNPRLPAVGEFKGCGAGEIDVRIETQPPGGTVYYIPAFFYELCKAQKFDPEDRSRCNRWREADHGTMSQFAGYYMYLARWPDGAIRRGTLDIKPSIDGETKLVVRKQ